MDELPGFEVVAVLREEPGYRWLRAVRRTDLTSIVIQLAVGAEDAPTWERDAPRFKAIAGAGVPGVQRVGSIKGRPAVFLDDPGGPSLDSVLRGKKSSIEDTLELAAQLAEVVSRLHRAGVVHGALHPGAFMCGTRGRPPALLSVPLPPDPAAPPSEGALSLRDLAYASPEKTGRVGGHVDQRSDLYSLGVIFYELFCGRVPFTTNDPLELVHAHLAQPPVAPSSVDARVPEVLSALIERLLSKHAGDRYQTAGALAADLRECLKQLRGTGIIATLDGSRANVSGSYTPCRRLFGRGDEHARLLDALALARGARRACSRSAGARASARAC